MRIQSNFWVLLFFIFVLAGCGGGEDTNGLTSDTTELPGLNGNQGLVSDGDDDGADDTSDNCPNVSNPGQADLDLDGVGDACDIDDDGDGFTDASDNCPAVANANQADSNANGVGDACETSSDGDNDGIADSADNCPNNSNANQADSDNDGVGDVCDTSNNNSSDADNDGVANNVDNCPNNSNANQADSDNDGIGDVCDTVNNNQGAADSDNDGVADSTDNCPGLSNASQTDTDNDGAGDACDIDDDADGITDTADNCPFAANPTQLDTDSDGLGDACDTAIPDADSDGVSDSADNCPANANTNQSDLDVDGFGDVCDIDDDGDGVTDTTDNCPLMANATQADTDTDGIGDVCDTATDTDSDGIPDATDNCPSIVNPNQTDSDNDGTGDACDSNTDTDSDGIDDAGDNCPAVSNAAQTNTDSDTDGDACDTDDDNDNVLDAADNCPLISNAAQTDTDNDGTGDVCDTLTDTDNDGIADTADNCPADNNPAQADTDNDGTGDACDSFTDSDSDGLADASDNCPLIANPTQADADSDGLGDACDGAAIPAYTGATDVWEVVPTIYFDNLTRTTWDCASIGNDCAAPWAFTPDPAVKADLDAFETSVSTLTPLSSIAVTDLTTEFDRFNIVEGQLLIPHDGEYQFYARSRGMQDVFIDGNYVHGEYKVYEDCNFEGDQPWCDDLNNAYDTDGGLVTLTAGIHTIKYRTPHLFTEADFLPKLLWKVPASGVSAPDTDNDGIADSVDNCPAIANPSQANSDGDAQGNDCDTDDDNDGVLDTADNCPLIANPTQTDTDSDGVGDACAFSCAGNDHLFAFMGQSNMQGEGDAALAPAPVAGTAYEYFLGSDSVAPMTTMNGEWLNYNGGNQLGAAKDSSLIPAFTVEYTAQTGKNLTAIHAARGGAAWFYELDPSFGTWVPGNDLMNAAKQKIDAAIAKTSLPLTGIVLLGGESDIAIGCGGAANGFILADFKEGVRDILRELKTSYNAPIYFIQPGHLHVTPSGPFTPSCDWASDQVRQGVLDLTSEVEFASYVKVIHEDAHTFRDSGFMYLEADEVHYNQAGLNKLGTESAANLVANQICN